jgi:hypothetical protein
MIDWAVGTSLAEVADAGLPDAELPPVLAAGELEDEPKPAASRLTAWPGAGFAGFAWFAGRIGTPAAPAPEEAEWLGLLPEQPASPPPPMMMPAVAPAMSTRPRQACR